MKNKFLTQYFCLCFCIFLFVIACLLISGCRGGQPFISHIDPAIGYMGDDIYIYGENFGSEKNESAYITIAGVELTISSYLSWSDNLIKIRISEFSNAGLIFVHRGSRKSNPVLFTDIENIPVLVDQ